MVGWLRKKPSDFLRNSCGTPRSFQKCAKKEGPDRSEPSGSGSEKGPIFSPASVRSLGSPAPQAETVAGRTYPRSGSRSPAAQGQSTESLQPLQERAQSGAQRFETLESIREPGRIEERAQDAKTAAHVESCRARPPEPLLRSASQRSGAEILSGHILRAPGRPSSSSELQPVFSASF